MGIYKLKNIILGIGLGLVVASLININLHNKSMTVDFIKKEALKKGLIILDPKDIINKDYNLHDVDGFEQSNIDITLGDDTDINKIADLLFIEGFINNKEVFLELLNDKSLKSGNFTIETGLSTEQIVKIITE